MARIVKRTPQEPTKFLIDGKEQWFCKCGLSKNQPYCDGSHSDSDSALAHAKWPAASSRLPISCRSAGR